MRAAHSALIPKWDRARFLGCSLFVAAILGVLTATPVEAQGDAARGKVLFTYEGHGCIGCHPQTRDPYAFGPSLCRVVGSRAGMHPAYDSYSDAIKNSGIVWDLEQLDVFLTFPMLALRGTTMGFAGIEDAGERADVIAYLVRENEAALCVWDDLTLPK